MAPLEEEPQLLIKRVKGREDERGRYLEFRGELRYRGQKKKVYLHFRPSITKVTFGGAVAHLKEQYRREIDELEHYKAMEGRLL